MVIGGSSKWQWNLESEGRVEDKKGRIKKRDFQVFPFPYEIWSNFLTWHKRLTFLWFHSSLLGLISTETREHVHWSQTDMDLKSIIYICQLCDHGQITLPLWASTSSSASGVYGNIKYNNYLRHKPQRLTHIRCVINNNCSLFSCSRQVSNLTGKNLLILTFGRKIVKGSIRTMPREHPG